DRAGRAARPLRENGEDDSEKDDEGGPADAGPRGGRRVCELMTTVYLSLIRHALAEERGEDYPDDSKRPLTSGGIARLHKEAKALQALRGASDHIITRPLMRDPPT